MKNIIGERFDRLTILEYSYTNKHKKKVYTCLCDCGNVKDIVYNSLSSGLTKSCGCLKKEKSQINGLKNKGCGRHNMSNNPPIANLNSSTSIPMVFFVIFIITSTFHISITLVWWHDVRNFIEDMGKKPSKDYSLDRIDSNKNYEPSNCRWVDWNTQNQNKDFSLNGINNNYNITQTGNTYSIKVEREKKHRIKSAKTINEAINIRDTWIKAYQNNPKKWIEDTLNKNF